MHAFLMGSAGIERRSGVNGSHQMPPGTLVVAFIISSPGGMQPAGLTEIQTATPYVFLRKDRFSRAFSYFTLP